MEKKGTIAVAMSGGVDSSVAALLLQTAGWSVIGISMRLFDCSDASSPGRCCCSRDFADARRIAASLGFPYYVFDFEEKFREKIIGPFLEQYLRGRTPSPCILCNSLLKFDELLKKAAELGAEMIATGHYARIARDPQTGLYRLLKGRDSSKDQSYFLFQLNQNQLSRTLFPVGEYLKTEIVEIAKVHRIFTIPKPESQELCFVRQDGYARFIEEHADRNRLKPGSIVTTTGKVIASHTGIHQFTVGQRRGLGVAEGEPLYVISIDPRTGNVVVGPRHELFRSELVAGSVTWISGQAPEKSLEITAKIRYRHAAAPGTFVPLSENTGKIIFSKPVRAVTPGQAVVFFDGDTILGGGWIEA
jgi:tRNA-specific 2-thiouridylase